MANTPQDIYIMEVFDRVLAERTRQDQLKLAGRFTNTAADDIEPYAKFGMLTEEIGEIARNLLKRNGLVTDGEGSLEAIHTEIVQLMAISLAWVEGDLKRKMEPHGTAKRSHTGR